MRTMTTNTVYEMLIARLQDATMAGDADSGRMLSFLIDVMRKRKTRLEALHDADALDPEMCLRKTDGPECTKALIEFLKRETDASHMEYGEKILPADPAYGPESRHPGASRMVDPKNSDYRMV